jgi:hypothetical protein
VHCILEDTFYLHIIRHLYQICLFNKTIKFSILQISQQYLFSKSKVVRYALSPNLEDNGFLFTSPEDRVAQLYSQEPGSLFIIFCYSQGYEGGILSHLQTGNSEKRDIN